MTKAFDLTGRRIWVAGHRGMVGSAVVRRLAREDVQILTVPRSEVDLRDAAAVRAWLNQNRPDVVVLAAAKVGGIVANDTLPADFLYENLAIETAVIGGAFETGVQKLLFLGSACIYPRLAAQPIVEEALLTGPLEPTNEWYAVAKIAGLKLCQAYRRQYGADFISAMPNNLYGPGDNYHPEHSHVAAGLIRRMDGARRAHAAEVVVWGTGKPLREFLYVDDAADACVHLLQNYSGELALNLGSGEEVSIAELAQRVATAVGYEGRLVFDTSRPDGAPRKLVDVTRLKALGWGAVTPLDQGLELAYADYQARLNAGAIAA
ncbi:MAG TPA: GDP-L-fucose synthase [Caulobacteraceae bacterium]|nr:GDP-L-fucose synthase [Caulobacteraceae bacterium]